MNDGQGRVMERTVWQIWSGPGSGLFAEAFLRHGVALLGPAGPGRWNSERSVEDYLDDEENGGATIGRFAAEMQVGDIVLMRTGPDRVTAIGIVATPYEFLECFDDVNGWDIPHGRRVRWFPLPAPYSFPAPVFASGHRYSKVQNKDVRAYAHSFILSPPTAWQESPLSPLPEEEPLLDPVPDHLRGLVGTALDLHRLYWNATHFGERPKEDEFVAHYVVPILRSMGWPPERIAIKWRNIDVALFDRLPRIPQNCKFIVEAKRPGVSLDAALTQARRYLDAIGVSRDILLTDGIRYHLYDPTRNFARAAYANLARLKSSGTCLFDRIKAS